MTLPPDGLAQALAGRYQLDGELGAGGMATVYLAHDLRHGRSVAVKVFRPELARSLGTDRFLREIQLAAQLNHPHIVALIDSGEADGLPYYLMPFVDGETLRAKLRREGPLPVDTALHITREVADALGYAHRRGVIHRDIKPENVLLADGHAFVADFGIARALNTAAEQLTQTGFALGTPAYMAPEQAVGDKTVDGRADLYALGCVLYEMLTGVPPYQGPTQQAILVKRFTEPVPAVRDTRAEVPEWLDRLVTRTLNKDPAGRPADAASLLASLGETWVTPSDRPLPRPTPAGESGPSIAVLPFTNMSADPDNEYFSDGISEELINALTRFPGLKVIARTSAFAFKGRNVDVREIGRTLGVSTVLEGSVRKAGGQLRITAQLIDATDGSHKWSERYDRAVADVFAVQDDITAAIRDAVGGALFGPTPGASRQTDETTFDLYLRGKALVSRGATGFASGRAMLAEATQRDPTFLPALIALADAYCFVTWWAAMPAREGWARVRALAARIAELDPSSAAADRLRGVVLQGGDRDFVQAERHLKRAVAANPSDPLAHGVLALVLYTLGRRAEAETHNRWVLLLDPLSPVAQVIASNYWATTGHFDEAEATASAAISLDPQYPEGYHMRGYVRVYQGRFQEASEDLIRVPDLGNSTPWPVAKRCAALMGLGRVAEVRQALQQVLARRATEFTTPDAIACIYGLLGERDQAFRWLETALEEEAFWLGFLGIEPLFAPLRSDPRFEPFCRRAGIPIQPLVPTALDRLIPPAPARPEAPSLVVLPFANTSPDPDTDFFADGLTEEVIADLSNIRALKVIARNSAMRLKGTDKDARTIGQELGVRYVLAGSVRRAGIQLRITAQLADAGEDRQVWAGKFTGTVEDVFDLQERLAHEIVQALRITLTTDDRQRLEHRPHHDFAVFECYQRARYDIYKYTAEATERAIRTVQAGLAALGEHELLLAALGHASLNRMMFLGGSEPAALAEAERCVTAIFARWPGSAPGRLLSGIVEYRRGNARGVVEALKPALTMKPNDPEVLIYLAIGYHLAGRFDQARTYAAPAVELDPANPVMLNCLGIFYFYDGRFNESVEYLKRGAALETDSALCRACHAFALLATDRATEADPVIASLRQDQPDDPFTMLTAALAAALRGDREEAMTALTPAVLAAARGDEMTSHFAAATFAQLGQIDEALDWLRHMIRTRGFVPYRYFAELDPFMAPLRTDSRFVALLAEMKDRSQEFDDG